MWCWCFLFDQHESCRTQKCRCGMCVVRKLVIGLTGRFKIFPSTSRQFGSRAYNLPRNLYKCHFYLYLFPHMWIYLQMQDRPCTHFTHYLLIYFRISVTANYASPVPQFRPSMTAQRLKLLCITLRACSDSSWLLPSALVLKKSIWRASQSLLWELPHEWQGCFLQICRFLHGREAHTDVKEEGEEREITFENGVAWERTEQLMATHLTSLQCLSREETTLEIKRIFLPVV